MGGESPLYDNSVDTMSVAIGLAFLAISIVLFLFSFLKILRKETGIIYLLIFRAFAALLFFAGYSIMVVPYSVSYAAYNTIQGSTIVQYPVYNVSYSISKGTQASIGGITTVIVLVMVGSVGIDFVMRMREKKG